MDTSYADHIDIPGVDASDIDVDNIEIPGVDVDIQEPLVFEIIHSTDQHRSYRTSNSAPGRCVSRADAGHTSGESRATQVQ